MKNIAIKYCKKFVLSILFLFLNYLISATESLKTDAKYYESIDNSTYENQNQSKSKGGVERKGKGINSHNVELNPIGDADTEHEEEVQTIFGI